MSVSDYVSRKQTNIGFIVKNTSPQKKTINILGIKVPYNRTVDLLSIPYISESDIRVSIIKGELGRKFRNKDLQIVSSSIDLLQFNNEQLNFIKDAGGEILGLDPLNQCGPGKANLLGSIDSLKSFDDTLVSNKVTFYTDDVKDWWQLDRDSAAVVDDITVVEPLSGEGRWLRLNQSNPYWAGQTNWYIDPEEGFDVNDGLSSLAPLKTWAEFVRRYKATSLLSKRVGSNTIITVNLLKDYPVDADIVNLDFNLGTRNILLVKGATYESYSGTINSFHDQETGALFWLNNDTASTVSGYRQMSRTASSASETTVVTSVNSGATTSLVKFMSVSGQPNTTLIPEGRLQLSVFCGVNNTSEVTNLYAKIYYYNTLGVLTEIATTSSERIISGNTVCNLYANITNTVVTTSDRIVIEIYGQNNTSGSRTITLYFNGTDRKSWLKTSSCPTQIEKTGFDWSPYIGNNYRVRFLHDGSVFYPTRTPSLGKVYGTKLFVPDITSIYYGATPPSRFPSDGYQFVIERCANIKRLHISPGLTGGGSLYFQDINFEYYQSGLVFGQTNVLVGFYGCTFRGLNSSITFNSNSSRFYSCYFSSDKPLNSLGATGIFNLTGNSFVFGYGSAYNVRFNVGPISNNVGSNLDISSYFLCHESCFQLNNTTATVADMGSFTYAAAATNSSTFFVQNNSILRFATNFNLFGGGFGNYWAVIYVNGKIADYDWLIPNYSIWSKVNDLRFQGIGVNKNLSQLPYFDATTQSGALKGQ